MLNKVFSYLRDKGLRSTLTYILARFNFLVSPPETPGELRARLARDLSCQLNHTVIAGLFTGLIMQPQATWGTGDRASHLLGTYEQEVQDIISTYGESYACLIDVGAADGYYAVGCMLKHLFEHCHAFEVVDRSRLNIRYLAELNQVSAAVTLHGAATSESLASLPLACRNNAFILMDIEGGEFDLLTHAVIRHFNHAFFVVELHPFAHPAGPSAVNNLRDRFRSTHETWTVGQGPRDPGQFDILRHLHDNERWLLVSENRGQWMEWLIAKPWGGS
ncbi:MAG: hypothetical protein ACK587_13965 [Cyanobacteriota bacterium]|jgi:hypothetical protein